MLKNAKATGTFSSDAQTAGATFYVLKLSVSPGVSLVIDNIALYRQEVTTQDAAPPTWSRLLTAPFPRLANRFENRTDNTAALAFNEGTPFTYSVEQIESRLAFSDVIAGLSLQNQTQNPDSIHRIRALNPNVVILPDRFFEQQNLLQPAFLMPTLPPLFCPTPKAKSSVSLIPGGASPSSVPAADHTISYFPQHRRKVVNGR
ncbi:MAG: hypothetical protein LAO55_23075 [Acidobacteriia bacterium]|nr:hypothetical protein [Terriglobia bacterium]